jgi:hypothetical protein
MAALDHPHSVGTPTPFDLDTDRGALLQFADVCDRGGLWGIRVPDCEPAVLVARDDRRPGYRVTIRIVVLDGIRCFALPGLDGNLIPFLTVANLADAFPAEVADLVVDQMSRTIGARR